VNPTPDLPITRLEIPSIGLDTEVVRAPLISVVGGVTWQVPSFVASHAERTGGAGSPGNAVLFGHVTSTSLGNVFEQLHRARPGDSVEVYSDSFKFEYQVVETRVVSRTDLSVIEPTSEATISLITCTGQWLPALHDYAQRLVVRGTLAI